MEETRTVEIEDYNDYVDVETAKLLKEAGFDWIGHHYYNVEEGHDYVEHVGLSPANWNDIDGRLSAPTLAVAQKWLREHGNWIVSVCFDGTNYVLDVFQDYLCYLPYREYDNYEEALSAGIHACLEFFIEHRNDEDD